MTSWIKKASSFIDQIDQVASKKIANEDDDEHNEPDSDMHKMDEDDDEEEEEAEEEDEEPCEDDEEHDQNHPEKQQKPDEPQQIQSDTERNKTNQNINEKEKDKDDTNANDNAEQTVSTQVADTADNIQTISSETDNNKSKPKKQSKSKKSKARSKHNKASTNNINTDYLSLKKQYEGMVKLWNEERANLKKAQQLLRSQKDLFKSQQQNLEDEHLENINDLRDKHNAELASKNEIIQSMEDTLLRLKEERNNKIEDSDELRDRIKELESEKHEILKEKSAMSLDKQQQIELIRKEFDLERKNWEKERKILTKNFERETFLENENVEYTNALARAQSSLQQKELENARLKGELKWIKRDKEELNKSNEILKEENESSQTQMDALQQMISTKNKEIHRMKQDFEEELSAEIAKHNGLKTEYDDLKAKTNENAQQNMSKMNSDCKAQMELEKRIQHLTSSLLEKQTELDMVISHKNEYKMKLEKLSEDAMPKKDIESGLIRRSAMNRSHKSLPKNGNRRNFTRYKSLNYGINVFDRIGLEFAHVLRNRPWIRLLIVLYIIVLHLWCFIVLHFSMDFSEDNEHH